MTDSIKKPDFFIVGAPKCGTTALDFQLSLHPEIFMAPKEKHYFGGDIVIHLELMREVDYCNLFTPATLKQVCGESSVWYLYSEQAVLKIHRFNPKAKIIIILRNPIEMLPSLHSQFLYDGDELIADFKDALLKDIERIKKGQKWKYRTFEKDRPGFINSVLYYNQVRRYLRVFGSEQVLIILHSEMKENFENSYRSILEFLQVGTDFIPSKKNLNVSKKIKNTNLHFFSKQPPEKLRTIFRTAVPFKSIRQRLITFIESLNVSEQPRVEIDTEVKELIISHTKNDILMLSKLINKDLSSWLL